jgi:hypothetical protein
MEGDLTLELVLDLSQNSALRLSENYQSQRCSPS